VRNVKSAGLKFLQSLLMFYFLKPEGFKKVDLPNLSNGMLGRLYLLVRVGWSRELLIRRAHDTFTVFFNPCFIHKYRCACAANNIQQSHIKNHFYIWEIRQETQSRLCWCFIF